jgi:hypothetical protein
LAAKLVADTGPYINSFVPGQIAQQLRPSH